MGRSSFEKIRGQLDLTGLLITPEQITEPISPERLFGRPCALELEIGSGKGLFLRKTAPTRPENGFIGVEIAYRYALISAASLAKGGVKNAVMINSDAATLLQRWIPSRSLRAVHVYFPDPWWKKSHRKRRILRADVLKLIEDRLADGGTLYFRTDVREYYLSTLDLVKTETGLLDPLQVENPILPNEEPSGEEEAPRLVERGDDNPPANAPPRKNEDSLQTIMDHFSTHFERRTRLHNLPVYGCQWTKNPT
ncbi:MAG: hypothetical protein IIZ25_04590 [Thermoguttaceae bacterium]|nr:hypothetical protein [Thermoguttaceae bacterium]